MYNLESCEMYGLEGLEEPIQYMEPARVNLGTSFLLSLLRFLRIVTRLVMGNHEHF